MARIQYPALVEPISTQPESTTLDRWYQPLSLPAAQFVRRLPVANYQAHTEPVAPVQPPPPVPAFDWFHPLSTPRIIRSLPAAVAASPLAWSTFTPATVVVVTVASWAQPLSQPMPIASRIALLPPPTGPPNTAPETTTLDRWYAPLSLPVQPRRAQQQQSHTEPVSLSPETTTLDRWHQPLSLPVPPRRAQQQQSHTEPVSLASETTTLDRWYQPLSLPTRRVSAHALQGPALAWSTFTPAAQATGIFNIHYNLSAWSNHSFTLGERCSNAGNAYQCIVPGTSTAAPTGTGSDIDNGGAAHFQWLSAIDYTSLQDWSSAMPGSQTIDYTVYLWNNGVITTTAGTAYLSGGWTAGSFKTLITCAPGESFRDKRSALYYNAANGVTFQLPAGTGSINYINLTVANLTYRGLQCIDPNSTSNCTIFEIDGAGSSLRDCLLDCFAQAGGASPVVFGGTGGIMANCLIVDRQGAPTSNPVAVANNTGAVFVGNTIFAVNGTAAAGAALDNASNTDTIARNNAVFGYQFVMAGASSASVGTSCTDSTSLPVGQTDLGGNLLSKTAANQFVSTSSDFRLKDGADCLGAAVVDTTDNPAGDDIFGRARGLVWDIGAAEEPFVVLDRWLTSLSQPILSRSLPVAVAAQPLAWSTFTPPVTLAVTVSSWFQPFSQPVRIPSRVAMLPPPTGPPNTARETTTLDRWYSPLSLPVPPRRAQQQQAHTEPVSLSRETTTVDRWHQPLSLPVRPRLAQQPPALAWSGFTPAAAAPGNTVADWRASFPDSVPRAPSGRQLMPAHVEPVSTRPETTTLDRWHQPLSLPTYRQRPSADFGLQVWTPFTPTPSLVITPPPGSIIITGLAPTLTLGPSALVITPPPGSIIITGLEPTLAFGPRRAVWEEAVNPTPGDWQEAGAPQNTWQESVSPPAAPWTEDGN